MRRIEISSLVAPEVGVRAHPHKPSRKARGIMALFCARPKGYIEWMKPLSHPSASSAAKIALGVGALATATGIAFAAWIDKGAGIFMAMIESGVAWCF